MALLVYTGGKLRQAAVASAQARALLLAESACHDQSLLVEDARNLLPALARIPEVLSEDSQACNTRFSELMSEYPAFANFGAIRLDGQLFFSAIPFTTPIYAGDRAYFKEALSTKTFAIGEYQIGRVTGKASINFGYPAFDASGEVGAVVFAALDLDWIGSLAGELNLPEGTSIMVFDNTGTILSYTPDPETWVGRSAPEVGVIQAALERQGKGVLEATGMDGTPRLFGYQPLEPSQDDGGVFIAVGIPTGVALAEVGQVQLTNYATLALALIATLAAAWVGGEVALLRGIRRLGQASRRLAEGDLTVRSGLQSDMSEIGELGRTFDEMALGSFRRARDLEAVRAGHRTEAGRTGHRQLSSAGCERLEQGRQRRKGAGPGGCDAQQWNHRIDHRAGFCRDMAPGMDLPGIGNPASVVDRGHRLGRGHLPASCEYGSTPGADGDHTRTGCTTPADPRQRPGGHFHHFGGGEGTDGQPGRK